MAIADLMGVDNRIFYDAVVNSGAATVSPLSRDGGYGNLDTAALFLPSREYYASRRNA